MIRRIHAGKPVFRFNRGIRGITGFIIEIGKGIIKENTDIAIGNRISYLYGNTGIHGLLKFTSVLTDSAVIVIRAGVGKNVRDGFHHGKAVCHIIIFLNDIFQGQCDFLRSGFCGIKQLPFQDPCGVGIKQRRKQKDSKNRKCEMGNKKLILHLQIIQVSRFQLVE